MTTDDPRNDSLDALLDSYTVDPASAPLQARIVANAVPTPPRSVWSQWLTIVGGWRIAGPALAASLMLGVGSQLLWSPTTTPATESSTTLWEMAQLAPAEEWSQ